MNIDPVTGLAQLPAGYYFKLSRFNNDEYTYTLGLMRKRSFWFDECLDTRLSSSRDTVETLKQWMTDMSCRLFNDYKVSLAYHSQRAELDTLLGKYPPKRLP